MIRRVVLPLWIEARLAYYRWALREIHPLHADLPHIVCRLNLIEAERRA